MFKSARLTLTVWYVIILFFITGFYSFIVYRNVMSDVQHASSTYMGRIQVQLRGQPNAQTQMRITEQELTKLVHEIKIATIRKLAILNIGILLVSGSLSYFLAGFTIRPIENMISKQKKFIADAAHDLKTPLTSVKSTIDVTLLDEKVKQSEMRESILVIQNEVDYMSALINRLLNQSKYENFKTINVTEFDLTSLINSVTQTFKAETKSKSIKIQNNSDLKNIKADETMLRELLLILVDNAVKYTPKGNKIEIESNVKSNQHIISVKNYGIEIDQNDLPYIFDRFYRGDKSRSQTNNAPSYGLGLSIAKEIVEKHMGTIKVNSQNNSVEFIVSIPSNLS